MNKKQKEQLKKYQKTLATSEKVLGGTSKDVNQIYKQKPKTNKGFWSKLFN